MRTTYTPQRKHGHDPQTAIVAHHVTGCTGLCSMGEQDVPGNRDALGSPSRTPALSGPLLIPDVHLEGLEGQLTGNSHEDAQAQLLAAVACHCMRHLMTHLPCNVMDLHPGWHADWDPKSQV